MLAMQLLLDRKPGLPQKMDKQGRSQPDFPWLTIQGNAAVALQLMPAKTPVVIRGAIQTRWPEREEKKRHLVTEVYVEMIAIVQIPGEKPVWQPPFESDASGPLVVGALDSEGAQIVAAFKSENEPMLNITVLEHPMLAEAFKRPRKGKHKKNKANRRARELAAHLQGQQNDPDVNLTARPALSEQTGEAIHPPNNGDGATHDQYRQ